MIMISSLEGCYPIIFSWTKIFLLSKWYYYNLSKNADDSIK